MDSTLPVAVPYKNQRGWLIAFGIIEILISCGLVFMTLFSAYVLLGPARAKIPPGPIPPLGAAVMAVLQYQLLAVLFFTGGIGSILCRNWARILMLVVSGLWLGIGLMSTLTMAFAFSATTHHHLGNIPAGTVGRVAVMFTFAIVMMVILPAICLIFYSRKSVRATCLTQKGSLLAGETPTTGLPVPLGILGVLEAVVAFFGSVNMFIFPVAIVFGVVLHGAMAVLVMLAISVLCACAAWMVFRQKLIGWQIAIFTTGFGIISALVSYLRSPDQLQLIRQMGYDHQSLRVFQQFPQFLSIVWVGTMVMMIVTLVFILYTRKFFPREG